MTAAIEDYEQKYNEENKAAMRRNRQKRESLQRDINRLTRQLEAKYDKLTELELQHTQDKLAELPEIKPLQIFTDDCTSECQGHGACTDSFGTARIYLAGHSGLFRRRTPVSGENLCQSSSFER